MTSPLLVSAVVLGAALLHATWNALVKTNADRLVTMAVISAVWTVLAAALALAVPLPAAAAWPYVALSAVLHVVYLAALLHMYRVGDLSHVYPIARGSPPLLLALLAPAVVGEPAGAAQVAGVVLLGGGILSLMQPRLLWQGADRRPIVRALGVGLLTVAYTLTDAVGVRLAGQSASYTAWMFLGSGLPWVGVLVWLRVRAPARVPLGVLRPGLIAGTCSMVAYGAVIWALAVGPVAAVAALRETSVIFAALIGTLWLGEPFGRRRVIAAGLVAAGVALLHLPT